MTLTDPRALEVWERIADSLAAIAATLTAPTARTVDIPDPNRCDPGCVRPSLHGGDCSPAEANEYAPGGWASEPRPEPEREPVVDLMAALKASVEAARKRREAVSGASIEPDPVAEAENGATD